MLRSRPGNEAIEVVAVRSERPEGLLVEEPLDPTAQANLVGVLLDANRPTLLAMPAAPQDHHGSAGDAGSHNPQGPGPA